MNDDAAKEWVALRRTFILRLLVELGGSANESIIYRGVTEGFRRQETRDAVRADLDHLKAVGCTTEEWFNDRLRVVHITERGEDAAHGRVAVAAVERSRWR